MIALDKYFLHCFVKIPSVLSFLSLMHIMLNRNTVKIMKSHSGFYKGPRLVATKTTNYMYSYSKMLF